MKIITTSQPISKKVVRVLLAFRVVEPEASTKLHILIDDQVSDSQKIFDFDPSLVGLQGGHYSLEPIDILFSLYGDSSSQYIMIHLSKTTIDWVQFSLTLATSWTDLKGKILKIGI